MLFKTILIFFLEFLFYCVSIFVSSEIYINYICFLQHQFGTDRKLVATPAARVASLHNATPNIAKLGDTRLKVLAGTRDAAQAQGELSRRG